MRDPMADLFNTSGFAYGNLTMNLWSSQTLALHSFGASHVGRRRQHNEDAYLDDDELGLWVVADGMGGHAAGEVASREACDAIYGVVKQGKPKVLDRPTWDDAALAAAFRLLEGAIQAATYIIFSMAELDLGKTGMGTTISAMMSVADHLILAQVGDSRIYRVRDALAEQLTEDHTLVAWQVKQGIITEAEARTSKQRNVITRAVGNRDYVQVDTMCVKCQKDDAFLLCSDGLHGYLEIDEIPEVVALRGQRVVDGFIEIANDRGGRDNITAILVEVS
jgi:serine/threonine protein phosphatase PrpC